METSGAIDGIQWACVFPSHGKVNIRAASAFEDFKIGSSKILMVIPDCTFIVAIRFCITGR